MGSVWLNILCEGWIGGSHVAGHKLVFFNIFFKLLIHVCECFSCMHMSAQVHAWCPRRPEEGVRSGTEVHMVMYFTEVIWLTVPSRGYC